MGISKKINYDEDSFELSYKKNIFNKNYLDKLDFIN